MTAITDQQKECPHIFGSYMNTSYCGFYKRACKICGFVEEVEKDFR